MREGRGGKTAIECGDLRVTYGPLFALVNQFGNALRSLALRIEERVLLLLLHTPEFAVSFFGAIKIGAVPVPVNTLLKPADYQYLLNNSRARAAVVSDSLLGLIEAIPRNELCYLERIVLVGSAVPTGMLSFAGPPRRKPARTGARAYLQRRRRVLALLVRQHKAAESVRTLAARYGRKYGALRQGHSEDLRARSLLQRRQTFFAELFAPEAATNRFMVKTD